MLSLLHLNLLLSDCREVVAFVLLDLRKVDDLLRFLLLLDKLDLEALLFLLRPELIHHLDVLRQLLRLTGLLLLDFQSFLLALFDLLHHFLQLLLLPLPSLLVFPLLQKLLLLLHLLSYQVVMFGDLLLSLL